MTSNGEEEGREEEEEVTTYRSTVGGGGLPPRYHSGGGKPPPGLFQTTFCTLPPLMQRVQTRILWERPEIIAWIDTRFGSQRRFVWRFA